MEKDVMLIRQDNLITATDYLFQNYVMNFTFDTYSKIGVFARNKQITSDFLLAISGISRSKGLIFEDKNLYDNEQYFAKRIYVDCKLDYFATLKPNLINQNLKNDFHKHLDEEKLKKMIKDLRVRQECLVRDEVVFNPRGRTLMTLATVLASDYYLLIDNIFHELDEVLSKDFVEKFSLYPQSVIFAMENLALWKNKVSQILIFGDFNNYFFVDPKNTIPFLHDKTDLFIENRLFSDLEKNKELSINLSKEMRQTMERKKIRLQKVDFYEIQKYLK